MSIGIRAHIYMLANVARSCKLCSFMFLCISPDDASADEYVQWENRPEAGSSSFFSVAWMIMWRFGHNFALSHSLAASYRVDWWCFGSDAALRFSKSVWGNHGIMFLYMKSHLYAILRLIILNYKYQTKLLCYEFRSVHTKKVTCSWRTTGNTCSGEIC